MKKPILILLIILIFVSISAFLFTNSGYGHKIMGEIKARGIIDYNVAEAVEMATNKCSQCHSIDQIKKYCDRCGPPFIVVVHNMRKYAIPQWKERNRDTQLSNITDSQASAIVQVWNATIGNWEHGWKREDIERLLEGDKPLVALLNTPFEKRKIESSLSSGEMTHAEKFQREKMGVK